MSNQEERKREINRHNRVSRQNEAIRSQQVVDQQSFNEPFKYNAPTRKSVAAKSASTNPNASQSNNSNTIILSLNVRLYKLSSDRKTQLVKTNVANPNSLEIMTHTLTITSNNPQHEVITLSFTDFNKTPILSVQIDALFGWTLLPIGTHDIAGTLGTFSDGESIYGVLTHDIDSISRWILVCRLFSMNYEHAALGYGYVDLSQDIIPGLHTAPIISEDDIVKVSYSLYAVKNMCDYIQADTTTNNSVLLDKSQSVMFTVGSSECTLPGIEAAVVGMRKRNVKALIIRRDVLEDDDNEDWPIKIKKDYFLVVEIAILNHRQSSEEVANIKSVVLDDQQHQQMTQRLQQQQQQQQQLVPPPTKKSNKKSSQQIHTPESDNEQDDLFGDDNKSTTKKRTTTKKTTKASSTATATTTKGKKNRRDTGPFVDSNEEEEGSEEEEIEEPQPIKSKSKKSTSKQQQQRHSSSAETVSDDDFEDDDDTNQQKSHKSQSTTHQQQQQQPLPVFLPGMTSNSFDPPPAVLTQTSQPQQQQQQQQQQQLQPQDEKARLAERMKKLASNSGMMNVAPTFNISSPTVTIPTSPTIEPTPLPQEQYIYQQPTPQIQQQQPQQQQYYQQPPPQQQQQQQLQQPTHQQTYQQPLFSPTYSPVVQHSTQHRSSNTVSQLLYELGLQSYTPTFATEALLTIDDLLNLTDSDWNSIQNVPTGVKRKIRIHLETHHSSTSTSSSSTPLPTSIAQTPVLTTSKSNNSSTYDQQAINDAYDKGKNETAQLYMTKIKDLKATANQKFTELNTELATVTAENQRNKEVVRQYVEKQRIQQQEQAQQLQALQQQLIQQQEQAKVDLENQRIAFEAERRSLLESCFTSFSSQVNPNDVLDGQQVNKILKDVLKTLAKK